MWSLYTSNGEVFVFPEYYLDTLLTWVGIRVLIGFSFKPMLSGERSSGEMHDGLRGLLGLPLNWDGLYNP